MVGPVSVRIVHGSYPGFPLRSESWGFFQLLVNKFVHDLVFIGARVVPGLFPPRPVRLGVAPVTRCRAFSTFDASDIDAMKALQRGFA